MSEPAKKEPEISPEVPEKAKRLRFTLAYKERILAEADQCTAAGELGELLRREGCTRRISAAGVGSGIWERWPPVNAAVNRS